MTFHCDLRSPRTLRIALAMVILGACGDGSASDYDAETVAQGAEVVSGRLCATCHLQDLSGATRPYPGTQAYPPNLTPDDETGLGLWSDAEITEAILYGVHMDGRQLCAAMPTYGSMGMSEEEAIAVVAYLRSLEPVDSAVPETVSCRASP